MATYIPPNRRIKDLSETEKEEIRRSVTNNKVYSKNKRECLKIARKYNCIGSEMIKFIAFITQARTDRLRQSFTKKQIQYIKECLEKLKEDGEPLDDTFCDNMAKTINRTDLDRVKKYLVDQFNEINPRPIENEKRIEVDIPAPNIQVDEEEDDDNSDYHDAYQEEEEFRDDDQEFNDTDSITYIFEDSFSSTGPIKSCLKKTRTLKLNEEIKVCLFSESSPVEKVREYMNMRITGRIQYPLSKQLKEIIDKFHEHFPQASSSNRDKDQEGHASDNYDDDGADKGQEEVIDDNERINEINMDPQVEYIDIPQDSPDVELTDANIADLKRHMKEFERKIKDDGDRFCERVAKEQGSSVDRVKEYFNNRMVMSIRSPRREDQLDGSSSNDFYDEDQGEYERSRSPEDAELIEVDPPESSSNHEAYREEQYSGDDNREKHKTAAPLETEVINVNPPASSLNEKPPPKKKKLTLKQLTEKFLKFKKILPQNMSMDYKNWTADEVRRWANGFLDADAMKLFDSWVITGENLDQFQNLSFLKVLEDGGHPITIYDYLKIGENLQKIIDGTTNAKIFYANIIYKK